MSIFNSTIDLTTALDWQRSNADILQQLVANQQAWLDEYHDQFWEDWHANVFTLGTANEFGLSVWSIILDEPIYGYTEESEEDYPDWGFSVDSENFFNGSFATDNAYTYEFTTEQRRILLQLKAYQVLSISGPVSEINAALANIFGDDVIICFDTLDMAFIYQLNDTSIANFISEIRSRDLLPRPIGIEVREVRTSIGGTFGFNDLDENFFAGNFYDGAI